MSNNDAQAVAQIQYWDAGAPAYRWIDLISARLAAATPTSTYPHRVYAYVALAMYDATLATWESKYYYNRPRPSTLDHNLRPSLPVPDSPSYPSEHAAAAQAAAAVLAYFLPGEAGAFQTMAEQAGWSRVQAGLQYPSDYYAGLALGHAVAERVIAKAQADGSSLPWSGTVPQGPCKWIGTNPGNVTAPNWTPLLLTSAGQFRPPAPPACDSPDVVAQTAAVRTLPRSIPGNASSFTTNSKAFYWQTPEGLQLWPYRYANAWISEEHLDQNPPRAARIYALIAASMFDAFIASQDGKFTYWYIRPPQLDPAIVPLFPVHAEFVRALGKEAGDSRIWAGIHFPMDNTAGVALGRSVAGLSIDWAEHDGSQEQ